MDDQNLKCLNGFSVLSFNVNNVYVSFKVKNYLFSNQIWQKNIFKQKTYQLNFKKYNQLENPEYWIIQNNDLINLVKVTTLDQKLKITESNKSIIGPFFNINTAKFIINTLQV